MPSVYPTDESSIEKIVCEYAEAHDWLVYKFSAPGQRGVPDRIFIKKGVTFFIEFKATGKNANKLQQYIHKKLKLHGVNVFVVDNVVQGKKYIRRMN
jgi:hypothetical protein|tara:strand:+ start:22 stop:312 length:291 start_codon:yes stop_codon:yes gene_type:complete